MGDRIQRIREVVAYESPENPWVSLFFDEVQLSDGRRVRFNRIVEKGGKQGVAVLPVMGSRVGLVKQYRYPVAETMWEIPRGFGESLDARSDAVRELEEETGIRLDKESLIDLGLICPNSGILASQVQIFCASLAPGYEQVTKIDNEVDEFRWFESERLFSMVAEGQIKDAFTLAALLRARLKQLID